MLSCSRYISSRGFALATLLAFSLLSAFVTPFLRGMNQSSAGPINDSNPSLCSKCHAEIVASYQKTAMAHASGIASFDPIQGEFFHRSSGVDYRVVKEADGLWLHFERRGTPRLRGRREFIYYIGSGRLKGRTYLFEVDQFLFESPINWYAQRRLWEMTPNYEHATEAPLNLPVVPECLNCHASGMQPPPPESQNLYPKPAFAHGGITCERCHGPARDHALHGNKMMAIDQLPADRRDAICMQCHLEGNATVERPHRHVYDFVPGEDLSDFVRYFVLAGNTAERGVSQFEALAQSQCKKQSGDRMSCTSCHDPHYEPNQIEAPAYFRQKCISCHGVQFARTHHPENLDCVGCHMPSQPATDVSHTEVTDHRILREASRISPRRTNASVELRPFPLNSKTRNDVRDLALAYESLVESGKSAAAPEAERLLTLADRQDPNDAPVETALGYIAQQRGDASASREYYERALHSDSHAQEAANNLAVIEASEGHLERAVPLWQTVFKHAPWRSSVGVNLALAYCVADRYEIARDYLNRVLEFNPDSSAARSLADHLASPHPSCSLQP